MKTRTVRFRVSDKEYRSLRALAKLQDLTLSAVVCRCINDYWRSLGRPKNAVFKERK